MKIKFSPQRSDDKINYIFEGEKIIVTIEGETDAFDFSIMPDGKMVDVETKLPLNPIASAERVNGELYVKLINFISSDATEEEKYPRWQEV